MGTNDKDLSPLESLQLIQTMINKAKGSVADDSFHYLLWGWLVFACCIVEYILKVQLDYPNHYIVWWMMPVGGIISWVYSSRQAKQQAVKTFVSEAMKYVWIALAIAFFTLIFINVRAQSWQTVFTYYILLYAIGTFVSGCLLCFRPLIIGGLFNFVLSGISIRYNFDYQLLFGALAILTSYIIPGHLLRIRFKKHKK